MFLSILTFFCLESFQTALSRHNLKWHHNAYHYIARTVAGSKIIIIIIMMNTQIIINTQITKKIDQFSTLKQFGPEKCPVYLRVPWIGEPSTNLEKEVKTAVESCYGSVSIRLVLTSKRMLPVARKDVLPAIQKSFVICEYKCHCDSRYVGRTSQRIQDRIKQHVPQWLRQQLTRPRRSQPHRSCKRTDTKPDCDSAIGQHLLDNDRCALNYDDKRFSILAAARSSFHLNLSEATYIKTRRPVLCRQKEFVYTLKLFR